MEDNLKEPDNPFDISTWIKTAANRSGGLSISQAIRIMNMIEGYGRKQKEFGYKMAGEENKKVISFLQDVAKNFDCDSDAHKYNTTCRACEAEKLLNATFSDEG